MPMSDHIRRLREKVGHARLLLPSVTALIFDEAGRVLLVEHADARRWVAPGGSIDPGEIPADALVREVWEETGLHVAPIRLHGVYSGPEFTVTYSNGDEVTYVMAVFECRILGGNMRPDNVETLDVRFFSQDEMSGIVVAPWLALVLADETRQDGKSGYQSPSWRPPASK
ncbi:MAG: NUDIX domain-containing protein [Deltaproteobacteria bacterium]|nr:NUDIX domain-containing protein [Deltaproteobacteria bacterium]